MQCKLEANITTSPETLETYNSAAAAYDAHVSDPADSPLHAYYEKPAMRDELAIAALKAVYQQNQYDGVARFAMALSWTEKKVRRIRRRQSCIPTKAMNT